MTRTEKIAAAVELNQIVPLPPVYVIYCKELVERRTVTEAHLHEREISPIWWRSVYSRTWKLRAEGSSGGSVGLALGHWTLWQHLLLSGVEEALVLEDDIVLPPGFAEQYSNLRRSLPPDWQFVFVGLLEDGAVRSKITETRPGGLIRLRNPFGTHCCLIRRSALPVLLDEVTETCGGIDLALYEKVFGPGKLQWWAAHPSLAAQRSQGGEWQSSIWGT